MTLKFISILIICLSSSVFAQEGEVDSQKVGPSATLTFEAKRETLTQESKDRLCSLVKEARAKGKVAEIQVAAWSDKPSPKAGDELSKIDRELAQRRGQV